MELISLWHLIKRRWWLMALPAVAALIVTLPTLKNVVSPPVSYLVQVRLTAAAPPEPEGGDVATPYEDTVYVPLLASEYVAVNMPPWITSDSFANEVSLQLAEQAVDIPAGDLGTAFQADNYRSIFTLYVTWDDASEIRSIADAAITVLQMRNQSYFPPYAAQPVRVVPLDDVDVSEAAPPIMARLTPLIRILMGLAAGVGLAILAEYLDDAIYTREDVEALGLPVLAQIPRDQGPPRS